MEFGRILEEFEKTFIKWFERTKTYLHVHRHHFKKKIWMNIFFLIFCAWWGSKEYVLQKILKHETTSESHARLLRVLPVRLKWNMSKLLWNSQCIICFLPFILITLLVYNSIRSMGCGPFLESIVLFETDVLLTFLLFFFGCHWCFLWGGGLAHTIIFTFRCEVMPCQWRIWVQRSKFWIILKLHHNIWWCFFVFMPLSYLYQEKSER